MKLPIYALVLVVIGTSLFVSTADAKGFRGFSKPSFARFHKTPKIKFHKPIPKKQTPTTYIKQQKSTRYIEKDDSTDLFTGMVMGAVGGYALSELSQSEEPKASQKESNNHITIEESNPLFFESK